MYKQEINEEMYKTKRRSLSIGIKHHQMATLLAHSQYLPYPEGSSVQDQIHPGKRRQGRRK
jgi:hypothetical protein